MSEETQAAPASASTGTVEEAAAKIEALLSGKRPGKKQSAPVEAAAMSADEQPAPTSDAVQAEDVAENEADETASDDDDAADVSTPEAEDETDSGETSEQTVTLEIEGKPVTFTMKELQDGVLRQADYTRKTQALAAERKQFGADLDAARQEREVYSQLLPALVQRMQASMPQAPDPSLIDVNPSAYLRQKEAYEQALGDLQAAASEQQRLGHESQVEQSRRLQAYVAENAAKLPELVPEWKDQKAYERDKPRVRDYLRSVGFDDSEIDQAYDARLVKIAADGMRWRELGKSKPRPIAPATEKPLRPTPQTNAVSSVPKKSRESFEARKRLASSGRVEDAALAIKALL